MYASHQGYTEIVKLLLKYRADPNKRSSVSDDCVLIVTCNTYFHLIDCQSMCVWSG